MCHQIKQYSREEKKTNTKIPDEDKNIHEKKKKKIDPNKQPKIKFQIFYILLQKENRF